MRERMMRTKARMRGMMPMLSALLRRCAFSLSAEEASSFWMSMPNRIMMPMAANEPAMVTVETVEVVTVEIMVLFGKSCPQDSV